MRSIVVATAWFQDYLRSEESASGSRSEQQEQCLKPVDEQDQREGSYPPAHPEQVPQALLCPNDVFALCNSPVAGISPDCTELAEGEAPATAVVGRNGFGELGWGGPQPPVGDEPHRYFFHLYALDRSLGLREGVSADEPRAAIEGHQLAHGTLVGLFDR